MYACDSSRRIAQEFRIKAYGDGETYAAEWGSYTGIVTINIDNCPPAVPFTSARNETSVNMTWTSIRGIEKYRAYYGRSGIAGEPWVESDINIPGTANSHRVTGLRCGTAYNFRLGALGNGTTYIRRWSEYTKDTATTDDCEVSFGASSYEVDEGEDLDRIAVRLSSVPGRSVSIPLSVVSSGTSAESSEYSVPSSVTFTSVDTSKTFTVETGEDTDCDDETLILGFGTLPSGVSADSPSTTTVTIDDDDTCGITVSGERSISSPKNATRTLDTYTADPSGVVWSLAGADADLLEIRSNGDLRFRETPDFDNPQDAGGNNVYNVTVTASKMGYSSGNRDVTINVTNVNEAPFARYQIGNRTLDDDTPSLRIDLSSYFNDPDTNDVLSYQATASPLNVVSFTRSGSHLTLARMTSGSTTVTVTATDGGGLNVQRRFAVSVISFPTLTAPVVRVDGTGENIVADFTLPDPNFYYVLSLMWIVCDGSPDCGGEVIQGNADKNPLNSGTSTFTKSQRPQPEKPPYRVGLKACTTASRDVCGSYKRSSDSVHQLDQLTERDFDVIPLLQRKAHLKWRTADSNHDGNTRYTVQAKYPGPGVTWTTIESSAMASSGYVINLEDVVGSTGLGDEDEFSLQLIAKDLDTPKTKLNSATSDTINIVDSPIISINGDSTDAARGVGEAVVKWSPPSDVVEATIRYRRLLEDSSGNAHDDYRWQLDEGSLPDTYEQPILFRNPSVSTIDLAGFTLEEVYAIQLNYKTRSGGLDLRHPRSIRLACQTCCGRWRTRRFIPNELSPSQ